MAGIDVSKVEIAVPGGFAGAGCKTVTDAKKNKKCGGFIDFARESYADVVRQLDFVIAGVAGKYLNGQRITGLKDVCPDIRLPMSDRSNFYPENVGATFARLTECRQKLVNSVLSDTPVPLAAIQCLKVELKEALDLSYSLLFNLPVGVNYKNCFEMTVPLANQITQLIDIRLPHGYEVARPSIFYASRTEEAGRKVYRLKYIRGAGEDKKTFLVSIRPSDGKWKEPEIEVLLVAFPVPATE